MSTEQNKAVVRRFYQEALEAKNPEVAVREIFAPNYRNFVPGSPEPVDVEGARPMFEMMFNALPDLRIDIQEMVAEGDNVAVLYTMSGTHQGALMGVPPTGKQISIRGVSFYRLKDGRIVDDYPGFDTMALMSQIGAMPQPEAAGR